ncbi:MAG: polysaccharide deacetylase family protein, partial [Clostridia bacterium]
MKRLKRTIIALIIFFIIGHFSYEIMNSRTFQFFGNIYDRVETEEKVIALTFDDGPTEFTSSILK